MSSRATPDRPGRWFEIRCPESRHLLGHLGLPTAHCEPGKPAVFVSVRDPKCGGVQVECTFVGAAPEPRDDVRALSLWRRQRRQEFVVRCPAGAHLLAHASVPTAFLAAGELPITLVVHCQTCDVPVETVFADVAEVFPAAPQRGQPGRAQACGHTR